MLLLVCGVVCTVARSRRSRRDEGTANAGDSDFEEDGSARQTRGARRGGGGGGKGARTGGSDGEDDGEDDDDDDDDEEENAQERERTDKEKTRGRCLCPSPPFSRLCG